MNQEINFTHLNLNLSILFRDVIIMYISPFYFPLLLFDLIPILQLSIPPNHIHTSNVYWRACIDMGSHPGYIYIYITLLLIVFTVYPLLLLTVVNSTSVFTSLFPS